ncbi:MAG: polysaccharide biosynthesis protein [Alphaproteobacteria bacterium]|nr:polysaccharide biosynthesis protein [Alphaproteobacteria bacterium]
MKNIFLERIPYFFQNRSFLTLMHDTFIVILSLQASIFLRLGEEISQISTTVIVLNTFLFVLFGIAIFLGKHVYRGMWRYASMGDLVSISLSVTYITLLYVSVMFLLPPNLSLPRSTPLINWFVLTAFLGAPRLFYRLYRQHRNKKSSTNLLKAKTVLIVGCGDQTELFIREILRQSDDTYELLGIIGYKNVHIGQKIHHVQVIGTISEIPLLIEKFKKNDTPIDMLIVADEHLNGIVLKSLVSLAESLDLCLARLPHISEITDPTEKPRVKPIAIEDLLGRPQTSLDRENMQAMIKGKRILVTGAGGTIGGELVRQISDFKPSCLCLVDHSEYLLYMSGLELTERHPNILFESVLADVACHERIRHVISSFKPELVFHAAALKHVPLVEDNPSQGCLTNIMGTRNVADACREFGVKAMLLISTDKAINPTSAMGATKRLAECYCQALDILERQKSNGTRYTSVRFGNVLGSSGSVVPLFKRQIKKGGPLTLTHPEMTRYFMTVHEAVELVLQAMTFSLHSAIQAGRVFVLDMGEPVKILDMAKQMISLAGLKPDIDIEIKYTGLRPGEKLFEELFHSSEHLLPTKNSSILLGAPRTVDHGFLVRSFHELEIIAKSQDDDSIINLLHTLVPEYQSLTQPKGSYLKVVS